MIRKSTWVVLIAFVILVGSVYLWQRKEAEQEAQVTPTTLADDAPLFSIQGAINYIRIERVGVNVIELRLDELGQWQITWPQNLLTDTQAAASALGQIANIPVITTLSDVGDLAALGLKPPVYRVLASTAEGQQYTVDIGKITPTNSGYYTLSGSRLLQVTSKYTLDPILELVDSPPVLQETPTPEVTETGLEATATSTNP